MASMEPPALETPQARRRAALALLLLVPSPSLGAALAMIVAPGTTWGQAAYGFSKVYLVAFPLAWMVLVDKERPRLPRPRLEGMGLACVSGVVMAALIAASYLYVAPHLIDFPTMRAKLVAVGFGDERLFLAGAVYWCTANSLLEEYVWRWFVLTRCAALMPRPAAILASGVLFTIHHTVALSVYFEWQANLLGSLAVCLGGATWSWLYLRTKNLYAAYVSHVFADVAIFTIGWRILFGG
jgi:membrane protease YdiL (CAAX protease family)